MQVSSVASSTAVSLQLPVIENWVAESWVTTAACCFGQPPPLTCCPIIVLRNFVDALVAVVLGNLIYFFAIMPLLPPAGRHATFCIDPGLAVDFAVCVAVYGVLVLLARYKTRRASRR